MPEQPISQPQLIAQLHALGVQPGGVLLVHCAFSKVKPVEGGPAGLIAALQAALGPRALVMPSMSWDDEHPFDPRSTPASKKWAWSPIPSGSSRASCAATARIPLPPLWPPGGAHHRPTRSRSLTASTARWGASTAGRAGAAARHQPPSDTTIPWPSCWRGCATAAPSPSSFARASRSPRRLRRERPLLPELCPRGWLAGREGSPAPRHGGSCRGAPGPLA